MYGGAVTVDVCSKWPTAFHETRRNEGARRPIRAAPARQIGDDALQCRRSQFWGQGRIACHNSRMIHNAVNILSADRCSLSWGMNRQLDVFNSDIPIIVVPQIFVSEQ